MTCDGGAACDDGCDDGGCCGRGWTCYVGVEATFLKAQLSGESNFVTFVDNTTGTVVDSFNEEGNLEDVVAAPRIWVCRTNAAHSVRYWEMNQRDHQRSLPRVIGDFGGDRHEQPGSLCDRLGTDQVLLLQLLGPARQRRAACPAQSTDDVAVTPSFRTQTC
jgi:hypothetical protein